LSIGVPVDSQTPVAEHDASAIRAGAATSLLAIEHSGWARRSHSDQPGLGTLASRVGASGRPATRRDSPEGYEDVAIEPCCCGCAPKVRGTSRTPVTPPLANSRAVPGYAESYTLTGTPRAQSVSLIIGSISSQLPPANPHPILGIVTDICRS
jgi:hypothetical protein